jgi:hypothetical protein
MTLSAEEKKDYVGNLNKMVCDKALKKKKPTDENEQGIFCDTDDDRLARPPQTLKEIFKISNRNRKRNKLKKKNKMSQVKNEIAESI